MSSQICSSKKEKKMKKNYMFFAMLAVMALLLGACGGKAGPATSDEKVTITVWDYYGDPNATPVQPVIEQFEKDNPNIIVKYEIMDWNATLEKLNVVLSGGTPPDVVTVDMTWLPKYAALGALADLKPLMADGKLNGVPLDQSYTAGALEAMTYNDKIVTMMYDFDVYALYYRADLLEEKGLQPPTTWDELVQVLNALKEDGKYMYEVDPDTFHLSQFIFENGGMLLNKDNTAAVFNSPEGVEAAQFYTDLVTKEGAGILWTPDQGEAMQGIKDGRIAMFANGPYFMGLLKSGAPEMAGKWRVAPHPYQKNPGSYLGGTGLAIPAASKNQEAAWKFIEYLLKPENAVGVYTHAGAAPALVQALNDPKVNAGDQYFGGQKTFEVFLEAMKTAHPFPYVRSWTDIDGHLTNAIQEIIVNGTPIQKALDDAAAKTEELLKQ
jgi:multiple sugar transport system substrate-binding protein